MIRGGSSSPLLDAKNMAAKPQTDSIARGGADPPAAITLNTTPLVSNPPPRPLMIWDGECHFCKRWIERWREITAGEVDYATCQDAAARFPEIPVEQFKRAVAFI